MCVPHHLHIGHPVQHQNARRVSCTDAAQMQKHHLPIMHMCQQDVHRWQYLLTTLITDMAAGDHDDFFSPSDSSMCAWITKSASNLREPTYTHEISGPTFSFAHKPMKIQIRKKRRAPPFSCRQQFPEWRIWYEWRQPEHMTHAGNAKCHKTSGGRWRAPGGSLCVM